MLNYPLTMVAQLLLVVDAEGGDLIRRKQYDKGEWNSLPSELPLFNSRLITFSCASNDAFSPWPDPIDDRNPPPFHPPCAPQHDRPAAIPSPAYSLFFST